MNGWTMASACWLLWLVAAGLTTSLASAATTITDKHLSCDPSGTLPCPPLSTAPIVDFTPERSVKRVRQPVHRLSKSYQEKYKLAVSRMKALPASHPLSFTAQAAIHQAYCDGHYQYDATKLQDGDGAAQPFDVHASWIFAPWHRMYIYFYERALAELVGDETFALPYWGWDAPEGMVIPPLFRDASANNSLYNPHRNQANLDKLVDLDYLSNRRPAPVNFDGPKDEKYMEAVNSNLCTVYDQQIRSGKGALNFLGGLPDTNRSASSGTLESMAHITMHVWTGKAPNSTEDKSTCALGRDGNYSCMNDMGFLGSAGRDPLFYSHHANVDRLWHIWSTTLRGGNGFNDTAWRHTSFVFFDGVRNPRRVRIKFRDVLDTRKLGYTYADVSEKIPLPWLKCNLTALVSHDKGGGSPGKVAPVYPLTLKNGVVVEVPHVALPAAAPGQERELVIDRIEYDPEEENKFDVAINLPKEVATMVAPQYKEFAGSFSVVPSSVKGGGKLEGKITLDIDQVLADIGVAGNATSVDVVIVPRTPHEIKLYDAPMIQNTYPN
ncbi:hypothetical protein U9M48_040517 [Paspalum notatum var. saurae]|uniref:Tyrosinase copper-binding domain-containing protein n=1 Tax=Paspalum notatum var. saurae TaxID=547442 RepID=A0AAQ3UM95_PASNO